MFHRVTNYIKGVLANMGLITKLQNVKDHKKISVNDDWYNQITQWINIYQSKADYLKIASRNLDGEKHGRLSMTMNMASISAKKMASLTFNQKAVIVATPKTEGKSKETSPEDFETSENTFIQETLKNNHFFTNFERYLEYMFVMGGVAIRLYVYDGQVKIRFATADSFYPISSDANGVTECVISTRFMRNNKYYTLLEWHEETDNAYTVKNELYENINEDDIGTKISLSTIYPDMEVSTSYSKTKYSRPTFIYLKPNISNKIDLGSPLGVPIFIDAIDTLMMLDQAYDLLFNEYRMGKRRIIVPDYMLKGRVNSASGERVFYFDKDEEVFQQYKAEQSGDTTRKPEDITMALRNDKIISGINDLLKVFSSQIGFSAGTFTFDGAGDAKTATEVVSENSATYQTKNSHETLIEEAIKDMCITILELAKNDKSIAYSGHTDVDVTVNFDDSIAKDRQENATYYESISGNKPLIDHLGAIKRFNNVTDVEAKEIYEKIKNDEQQQGNVDDILGASEAGDE